MAALASKISMALIWSCWTSTGRMHVNDYGAIVPTQYIFSHNI